MQFGIRLHDAVKAPLEERLKAVHEQGFACAHLALSKVISENSVADSALTPGYAMYLKRLFDKYGLDVAVLGCYLNLANPDPEKLKTIQNKYMANIRFAAHLGAGVVGTETGAPNLEYKFEEACWNEESLQTFINNLRPVVKYAEQMGVLMAIEPVVRHMSVPVGQGMCHWERVIPYMKKEKPFMHATLENTSPENAVAALEHIREIYRNS